MVSTSRHLPETDVEEFNEIIGLVYEGPLEASPWNQCLHWIRKRLQAKHVTLIVRPTTPEANGFVIDAGEVTAELVGLYHSYFYALDPFVGLPGDRVVTIDEIISREDWQELPYYQQFLCNLDIFHMLGADLEMPGGAVCRFRVSRSKDAPAFSDEDKAFCNLLLPHLRRSMTMQTHMGRIQSVGKLYAQTVDRMMVGTIILDEHGKILQTNQLAEELLCACDGFRRDGGGRLGTSFAPETRQLQRLIKEAIVRSTQPQPSIIEAMSLTRPSGCGSLGVVVHSVPMSEWSEGNRRPAVAVFIRDAERQTQAPQDLLYQLFSLTPAETALAMQLVNGLSLDEAAEVLNVKRNTARAHLRAIFSKTGVTRQTELVRMLLNSVAALGMNEY
jgi:DNA-binding CsgD family transcriptional regulator/PAS domain-containing protein